MINYNLTLEEKVAQVLVSFRFGNNDISDFCVEKGWGGIHLSIWDYQTFEERRAAVKDYIARSKIPPFITSDTESGLGSNMLKESTEFTTQIGLVAAGDLELVYEVGKITAEESRYAGNVWSFGPVVDVNTNPYNPSTNTRSFGADPEVVDRYADALIRGYQENGIIACAKHFPGQGHSNMNSHYAAEVIERTHEEMWGCELKAFANAAAAGVDSIMTNHAFYPAFDKDNLATMSAEFLTNILRKKMGFKGLLITDALEMAPVKEFFSIADSVTKVMLAGNDMFITENDYEKSYYELVDAVKKGIVPESLIDDRLERILAIKEKYGILDSSYMDLPEPDLAKNAATAIDVAGKSICLKKNTAGLVPLKTTESDEILLLLPGENKKLEIGVHYRDTDPVKIVKTHHQNVSDMIINEDLSDPELAEILVQVDSAKYVLF
ncbi:MAG: glycoside hydrolase family 3 protein, partial [Planctomycetota bacterium]